jgi:glycosyltransferase involved in cell wall biosynthesis
VGRKPPPWLYRVVENARGVELHADVPDVRPFLHECGVLAVPLRIGGGSRLKILEALATATPVVSTKVGAEGLALESDRHYVEVEEVEGMADALIAAVKNPGMLAPLADLGRQVVLDRYDWNALAAKLEQVWLDCAPARSRSVPAPHRTPNRTPSPAKAA